MFGKLILSFCLIVTVSSDTDCGNVKCADVPQHYSVFGCTPVKVNNECCPSRYECPDKSNLALDKCYWQDKVFNVNDRGPSEEASSLCLTSCFCAKVFSDEEAPKFLCAQIDCPHHLKSGFNECAKQYTLDSCCPKYLCNDEEKKTLGTTTCEVDGISYSVGERIYPKSKSCYKCVCTENFDNSTIIGNPACKEINCGVEFKYFADFRNGCIPRYWDTNDCCPIGWRCPESSDKIIPSENHSTEPADTKAQCQFGKLTLQIGDEISKDSECEVCKCVTPPLAHCVKTLNCNAK